MNKTELKKKIGLTETKFTNLLNRLSADPQWEDKVDVFATEIEEELADYILSLYQPKELAGSKEDAVEAPLSNLEALDWTKALEQIGTSETVALSLVEELELNRNALTISDVEVLKELAIAQSVQSELAQSAQSLRDAQLGSFTEALAMAVDANLVQAELIEQAGLNAYLQESLRQTEIAHQVKTAIYTDTIDSITKQMALLGGGKLIAGKRPNEIIQELGQAATQRQATTTRKRQARQSRQGNYLN